ncbi:poly(ADP-ribose) polymerase family member 14-related sequence 1 [Electrophorus electricus]|uniref:Poly [ADP-ribose] polymerase n=1 Tax=Electrophorus electricus TaxID=8005 RepID=A0A4W4HF96_ELEEL|nr:poly(ADP-ribose) polymerase family member 14-related sequence 1 [Electrophorus electricus]
MAEEFPYALFVEGKWDPETPKLKNKLTIYFQSRKSNGGDCSVQYDASDLQRAIVRFKLEEVRENVIQKPTHQIKLGKDLVTLNVYPPSGDSKDTPESKSTSKTDQTGLRSQEESPAQDESATSGELQCEEVKEELPEDSTDPAPRSAVLSNIQNMSQEFLHMLVENVLKGGSESKEFNIEFITESNCAVVTFPSRKGAEHFIMSCPGNSVVRRKNLEVSPLKTTKMVKAEDVPSGVNSDYFVLYFEKFGEVEDDVEILEDEQSAIITFCDHTAVNTVLKAQHQIKKHPIRVYPYYASLGTALYGRERPTLKLPETFIQNIDKSIWKYLQENQRSLDLLMEYMSKHWCQLDLGDTAVRISPHRSLLCQGVQTRKLLQMWKEKASAEFTSAMSKYKALEIPLQRDAWVELATEVPKILESEPVTLVLHKDQGTIIMAGLVEDVCRTANIVKNIVDTTTQRIQREIGSVTDELLMDPSIYEIIMLSGLKQNLKVIFPELDVNYHKQSQKITLYGLKQEVLESKNKILQEIVSLHQRMVELKPSILEFLCKGTREELNRNLFLSKGISASLEIKENHAWLFAKTEKSLSDSEEQLTALLCCKHLDVEDPTVLRREEWHNLVANLNITFNSKELAVVINTSDNQVEVSGFVQPVLLVQEQLSEYINNNSLITETFMTEKIIVRFIQEHKKENWFDNVKNNVNVDFKDNTISLYGPRIYVSQCKPLFEDLLSSVFCCNFKVAKPGARKSFKNKETMYIATAKNIMGCLVELADKDDLSQVADVTMEKRGVLTPDGVEIIVNKGDMCYYPVDAVVNPANEKLDFNGGLSMALSTAAGPQLQEACKKIIKKQTKLNMGDAVLTEAGGQLRCRYVIHAVGPLFDASDPQKAVRLLKKAVIKSLNLADRENCQSLAIPAISSGNYGFPLDLCADTIVAALKEFFEFMMGDTCLRKIHLIDNNVRTVEALKAAVQKVYGQRFTSQKMTSDVNSSNHQQNLNLSSSSSHGSSQSVKTNEGLTITISQCNIQDASADVVVNSISSDLALNHGAISSAIFKAAGPHLQDLLNQHAVNPAPVGAIFVTNGCNLKTSLVFHAVAPHWKGSEQKVMEDIMSKCLDEAEQRKQGSIVFPAIGTGNLGFPKSLVASLMLDSIVQYSKKNPKHVQKVMFALHPKDTETIKAFTDEFNKSFNTQSSPTSAVTQQQYKGPFSKITSPISGTYETMVGGVMLQVLNGDITIEKTDVIVNSSNDDFTMKSGVSKAVLDAAGPIVEAECKQLGAQQNQGLIMTQQGNLQCKKIIHISGKSNPAIIRQLVMQALKICVQQNFTSISFPAFGTGQGGVNAGLVADAMLDAVIDFVKQTPQSSLRLVRIVIFQAPMLADFHQSMLKREATDKQKKGTTLTKIISYAKSWFGSGDKDVKQQKGKSFVMEDKVVHAACFSICGPSQAAVHRTQQWLEKLISEEQAFQEISDAVILSLSDKDIQRIQDLQQDMDISVRMEFKSQAAAAGGSGEATIIVEGITRDVLAAASEIQTMIKRTREEVDLKKQISMTLDLVDWQYQQGGQYHSFDPQTNYFLEKALAVDAHQADITFQGQLYKVTMPDGPAVSGSNQMNIRRVDKLNVASTDSLPQEWDTMKADELFKVCPLQSGSKEYNDVLSHFRKTCNKNVIKIERIQNPGIWKNYQNNKTIMEHKNKHQNNEKRLFHGTRPDSKVHINMRGFNRSYAGLNAAAFGKGTYFALNASYSAQPTYSVPDQQGQRHMYLCRVLTGDYTVGNHSMIVPPPKTANSTDLYDTVVDNTSAPTIFVVFRDDNAYPEYLITFT